MSPASKKSRIIDFLLIFALVYLLSTGINRYFFPSEENKPKPTGIELAMEDATVRSGNTPVAIVRNHTDVQIMLPNFCPMPPFAVAKLGASGTGTATPLTTTETAVLCEEVIPVPAQGEAKVSLAPWKYSLFGENGTYQLKLDVQSGHEKLSSATTFEIYEPGMWAKLFRSFITKPFLNFLIFVGSILPSHNLGVGIIILTLVVKLLLFYPTQKSLEGQKKMQLLQPKLEAVKKQYASDPTKMQQETVRLWKEHGVNPLQSCLPIVFQIPLLIGLFYVIRDDAVIATSQHLVYSFYQDISWSFSTNFLGLDLTKSSWIFPPLLIVLQYLQMKLSFQIVKNKQLKDGNAPQIDRAQHIQQQVMLYAMPLMIGFFAIQFPSAVSLYWGVSTVFAIGQQLIVNREHLKV